MERSGIETIIYGGAFNPPTLAHQAILQACVDYAEPRGAEVWLLPSGNRADKPIETPPERRLELCDALIKDIVTQSVRVGVNSFEIDSEKPTQTHQTVQAFHAAYPDRSFRWVFGADSIANMHSWAQGEWLKDTLPMLVVNRPGSSIQGLGENTERLPVESPISSTQVRQLMRDHKEYKNLVGAHVYTVLQQAVLS